MMNDAPLRVTPVTSLSINIDPYYVAPATKYLEKLGCRVTFISLSNTYCVQLPANTQEEIYAGQSTPRQRQTTLRFPSGETLQKYTISNDERGSKTTIAFPNSILPS